MHYCINCVYEKDILDYSIYARAIEKESGNINESIIAALKYYNITNGNIEQINQFGEMLYNSIPLKSPKVGIKYEMLNDFYLNDKTEFEIVVFCAFCAVRSFLLFKAYFKATNNYMLIRMAGLNKKDEINNLPETLKKYNNRYQLTKIKNELQENWNLIYYSVYIHGFYVSFDLTLEQLSLEAEKKKIKYIDKKLRTAQGEARKKALKKLYETTTPI
jgi:hypothetical protein